jgi:hypothetical protein
MVEMWSSQHRQKNNNTVLYRLGSYDHQTNTDVLVKPKLSYSSNSKVIAELVFELDDKTEIKRK